MTSFAAFETKTLSASSVNVHSVWVALSGWLLKQGLIVVLRARGVSLKEASSRGHRGTRVRMVGSDIEDEGGFVERSLLEGVVVHEDWGGLSWGG